jgi:hypothetical protein
MTKLRQVPDSRELKRGTCYYSEINKQLQKAARPPPSTSCPARFVRTLVVEDIDELVEARLLLQKIAGRRFGGFFFRVRCMQS